MDKIKKMAEKLKFPLPYFLAMHLLVHVVFVGEYEYTYTAYLDIPTIFDPMSLYGIVINDWVPKKNISWLIYCLFVCSAFKEHKKLF